MCEARRPHKQRYVWVLNASTTSVGWAKICFTPADDTVFLCLFPLCCEEEQFGESSSKAHFQPITNLHSSKWQWANLRQHFVTSKQSFTSLTLQLNYMVTTAGWLNLLLVINFSLTGCWLAWLPLRHIHQMRPPTAYANRLRSYVKGTATAPSSEDTQGLLALHHPLTREHGDYLHNHTINLPTDASRDINHTPAWCLLTLGPTMCIYTPPSPLQPYHQSILRCCA